MPWKSLTYSGAALTGAGVVVGLIFRGKANATQQQAEGMIGTSAPWEDYRTSYEQWQKEKSMAMVGYALAGASGVVTGLGAWQMKAGTVTVAPSAAGRPGLTLRWIGGRR